MTKILATILSLLLISNLAFGSPLIYKVSKTIASDEITEVGTFDALKYRQIRIGIKVDNTAAVSKYYELSKKRQDLETELYSLKSKYTDEHPKVREIKQEISNLDKEIRSLGKIYPTILISGVEGQEQIPLFELRKESLTNTFLIESPPSKISIKVEGKGNYSFFVWGSL